MSHIGDGRPRAMLAEVMKIPDPIIDPATSIVASVRDIALTNPVSDRGPGSGGASVRTAELLMRGYGKSEKGVVGNSRRRFRRESGKCRYGLRGSLDRGGR
jgi:hypothetical protein